jgi:hypothetical protein
MKPFYTLILIIGIALTLLGLRPVSTGINDLNNLGKDDVETQLLIENISRMREGGSSRDITSSQIDRRYQNYRNDASGRIATGAIMSLIGLLLSLFSYGKLKAINRTE